MNFKRERESTGDPSELVGKVLDIDPSELVRGNLAVNIVDRHFLEDMERKGFNPTLFGGWPVVRVSVETDRGVEIMTWPEDGIHRTVFAHEHKGKSGKGFDRHTFDTVRVVDTTPAGVDSISVGEYLEAVITHTRKHKDFASKRMAAHILTGWEGMVGKKLAQEFSALEALSFLNKAPVSNEKQLSALITSQTKFVEREDARQRQLIEQSLLSMGRVLQGTIREGIARDQVYRAVFTLIVENSSSIGGQKGALQQVYNWLESGAINSTIQAGFRETTKGEKIAEQTQYKAKLREAVFSAMGTLLQGRRDLGKIEEILTNADLQPERRLKILNSANPRDEYAEAVKEINFEKLTDEYVRNYNGRQKRQLSPIERQLLENFGKVQYLDSKRARADSVAEAFKSLQELHTLRTKLTADQEDLIKRGVPRDSISQALAKIDEINRDTLISNSTQTVSRKRNEIRSTVQSINNEINQQINSHRAKVIVSESYSREFGKDTVDAVVQYLRGEQLIGNDSSTRQRLRDLKILAPDLQYSVINREKTISFAQQEQRRRDEPKPVEQTPKQHTLPRKEQSQTAQTKERLIISPREATDKPSVATERRVRTHNENLQGESVHFAALLDSLDLLPTELTSENRELLMLILKKLGTKLYDHPNIPKLIEDSKLLNKKRLEEILDEIEERNNQLYKASRG